MSIQGLSVRLAVDDHMRAVGRIDREIVDRELGAAGIDERRPEGVVPFAGDDLGHDLAGELGRLRPVAHERLAELDRGVDRAGMPRKTARKPAANQRSRRRSRGGAQPHQRRERRERPQRIAPHRDRRAGPAPRRSRGDHKRAERERGHIAAVERRPRPSSDAGRGRMSAPFSSSSASECDGAGSKEQQLAAGPLQRIERRIDTSAPPRWRDRRHSGTA